MSERLITILLQGAIALLMCITLNAQGPPPAALERAVLEKTRVSVVQADSGDEAEGRLISVTPTTLSLLVKNQRFDVPLQTLSRVDAIGDPVSNGAIIGGLVLGIACAIVCGQGLDDSSQLPRVIGANAAFGALIGAGMDWSHTGRRTIYSSPGIKTTVARVAGRVTLLTFHFGPAKLR